MALWNNYLDGCLEHVFLIKFNFYTYKSTCNNTKNKKKKIKIYTKHYIGLILIRKDQNTIHFTMYPYTFTKKKKKYCTSVTIVIYPEKFG